MWLTYGDREDVLNMDVEGLSCSQRVADLLDGVLFITPLLITENTTALTEVRFNRKTDNINNYVNTYLNNQ